MSNRCSHSPAGAFNTLSLEYDAFIAPHNDRNTSNNVSRFLLNRFMSVIAIVNIV